MSSLDSKNWFFELQKCLALFAMTFFAIIPQGYMLETSDSVANKIAIVICNAQGEFNAFMDNNGNISFGKKQTPEHEDKDTSQHCNFAGFTSAGLISSPVNFIKVSFNHPQRPMLLDYSVTIGHGLAAPPPPKTGPPTLI